MTKDRYGFGRDNQWCHDRVVAIAKLDEVTLEPGDLVFIQRLCKKLYSEDRLSGDEMRNIAQKLDGIIEDQIPRTPFT